MISARRESKRFIGWLERYNHPDGYENIGMALHSWLVEDDGATRLGFEYAMFLQLVIYILVTENGPFRVGIDVANDKYKDIALPTSFDGWLPDRDDFQCAVEECKIRHARR